MEPSDILATGGGAAGVGVLAKYIWDSVRQRKEQLEDRAEETRDAKLDTVLEKLGNLELEFRGAMERIAAQTSTLGEVRARVEGISANYGQRISEMEKELVAIRTRVEALEYRKRR